MFNPVMLIFIGGGVGLIVYALFWVFSADLPKSVEKQPKKKPINEEENSYTLRKLQQQKTQIEELENTLRQLQEKSEKEKIEFQEIKIKQESYLNEIKRREEWVAKAEAELAKVNGENLGLKDKFMNKEKELQEEFAKNVKLAREKDEVKLILLQKEAATKLKEEEMQIQHHQLEKQLKDRGEHLAVIAEFERKEKVNQWVAKEEFDKLNEEYTQIEKELEANQEKLKKLSEEIAHLRLELKKNQPVNIVLPQAGEVSNLKDAAETKLGLVKENPEATIEVKPQEIKNNLAIIPEINPQDKEKI